MDMISSVAFVVISKLDAGYFPMTSSRKAFESLTHCW